MSFISDAVFALLSSRPTEKFTAHAISHWIVENYSDVCAQKQHNSQNKNILKAQSDDERSRALRAAIGAEIGAQRKFMQSRHPEIKTTENRPRLYYFTTQSDNGEVEGAETTGLKIDNDKTSRFVEKDMYPILASYLFHDLGLFSKRINEKTSRNGFGAGGNKWLHPDLVALEDLTRNWHREIKGCVNEHSEKSRLWSFEVKLLLNRSNIREAFFQTVSNSTWANYAYLVSSSIEGTQTMNELRMLCNLHSVGLIVLNPVNPSESNIVIPAKERLISTGIQSIVSRVRIRIS